MSGYSNGIQITYTQAAFAGVSSAGQSVLKFAGPAGLTGRLLSMIAVVTTATTGAAARIDLKNNASAVTYGSIQVVAAVAELVGGATLVVDDVSDTAVDVGRIPADAVLELDGDGGNTLGAVTVQFTIEWS